ncbi:UNVERIFIED_CONTAM: hypothetical protein Slati_3875900 [Sesamum latifolium]|uniref:Uncharacterized protein n=1 Tax=Sesamum latifolium TaxID=2727402 RepID=A0AAW2TLB8_9LAMI
MSERCLRECPRPGGTRTVFIGECPRQLGVYPTRDSCESWLGMVGIRGRSSLSAARNA